jgi:hypothetical protein
MTEFILPEIQPNERADLVGLDLLPATFGEGFGAAFDEQMTRNPTATIFRALRRQQFSTSTDEFGNELPGPRTPSRVLTADEANAQYGIPGKLKWDADVPEPVAQELRSLKEAEIERQDTLRRAQAGLGTNLSAGLVASILDPLNVASAFIPVVGPARFGALAARFGTTGARAISGAVEGAVGAALLEPIVLAGAAAEQADYDITDSLLNVAFGTVLGAGLHLAGGAVGDRLRARAEASSFQRAIDDLSRADQEALGRTALAQMVEGRPIDVLPVLDVVRANSRERLLSGASGLAYRAGETPEIRVALETPGVGDVLARQAPDLMERVTELQRQGDVLRASLAEMGDDKLATVALKYDQQIATLQQELQTAGKKRGREIAAELSALYDERAKAREAAAKGPVDIPEMAALRQRLMETDEALRDLAVELSAATARAEKKVSNLQAEADRITAKLEPVLGRGRAAEAAQFPLDRVSTDAATAPQRAVDNLRALDGDETKASAVTTTRVSKEQGAPKGVADEIKSIEDDLLYLESLRSADSEPLAASAAEKEATVYGKAWREAAACSIRKG